MAIARRFVLSNESRAKNHSLLTETKQRGQPSSKCFSCSCRIYVFLNFCNIINTRNIVVRAAVSYLIPITFYTRTFQMKLTFPTNSVLDLTAWRLSTRLNFLMTQTLSSGCCTNTRTSRCNHCSLSFFINSYTQPAVFVTFSLLKGTTLKWQKLRRTLFYDIGYHLPEQISLKTRSYLRTT